MFPLIQCVAAAAVVTFNLISMERAYAIDKYTYILSCIFFENKLQTEGKYVCCVSIINREENATIDLMNQSTSASKSEKLHNAHMSNALRPARLHFPPPQTCV